MASFNPYVYNKALLRDFSYFTLSEFNCNCHKCRNHGNPSHINAKLLTYLEQMRQHFGVPCIVTSGLRCKTYNKTLKGSSRNSRHLSGMAVDVYFHGVAPKDVCAYWKSLNVGYCYYGTSNMGNVAHVQIGW